MIGNKIAALALLSAVADQTLAAPGHQHRQLHAVEKRALTVEVVTEVVTVTVTYGAEPSTFTSTSTVDKGGIFVDAPVSTSSTSVVQQVENQNQNKVIASSSSVQVQDNVQAKPTTTSTTIAAPTTTAQPTTTAAPSSSSTTSEAPKTTSASSGGSGSGKRGVGYNDGTLAKTLLQQCGSKCGWTYNWEVEPKGGPSDIYVPSLKDNSVYWKGLFNTIVNNDGKGTLAASSRHVVFSLNEPDNAGEAGGTISDIGQAVSTHVEYLSGLKGYRVGAPSVTNGQGTGVGLDWLKSFKNSCSRATKEEEKVQGKCWYDFCNIHWYHLYEAKDTFLSYVEQAHEVCGGPLYITEFALKDGTDDQVAAWVKEVVPKLDALDYVEGYSYFMAGNARQSQWNLFDASGNLNTIGQAYASA